MFWIDHTNYPSKSDSTAHKICIGISWTMALPSIAFLNVTPFTLKRSSRYASWRCTASVSSTSTTEKAVEIDGGVTAAKGFRASGVTAGLKPSGLPDLAVVVADGKEPATAGAVFTTSMVRAAPVLLSESHLAASGRRARAVVINSGQANAATGDGGYEDSVATAKVTSNLLSCPDEQVLVCSTGVIGVRIPREKLLGSLPTALKTARVDREGAATAAKAVLTTDTRVKEAARTSNGITVGGFAKGSGMIHPDMATMIAVLTCDATVQPDTWQRMVAEAADKSFNSITVDGDTSTNDSVIALASGAVQTSNLDNVQELLTATMTDLAKAVARDGEGSTVLIEVQVRGARSNAEARKVARTVASSSLFKAAVFGRDPNWGRIAAAAGRSGVMFEQEKLEIEMGPHKLMVGGQPIAFDAKAASEYLKGKASAKEDRYLTSDDTVVVGICIGDGVGIGTAWGCDLSQEYVTINSEYTT